MSTIRVLVVDDSLTVRGRIAETVAAEPGLEVVGQAENGKRGIELCEQLRPDIVTLDMMMPVMTGVAATEWIMAHCPTPILIVSSSTHRGELFKTYDALAAGAVDVFEKPRGDEPEGAWERGLVGAIKMVARIKVITHVRARLRALQRTPSTPPESVVPRAWPPAAPDLAVKAGLGRCQVIAIGTSTGGPAALVDVLRGLPPSLPVPILIVLHLGEPFAAAFADWLDAQTSYRVAFARDGEPLAGLAGRVALAPAERHLHVRAGRLVLSRDPARHSCRPSVDVLFESLAREMGPTTTACLLTGMGRDGASGLLEIRRAGGITIAQDEASSVVYGMPREAALLGAAMHITPLPAIAGLLARVVREGGP
jgi:two-component system, chemotaxis family, protein-glutamate methylesterase/glutaminase